MQSSGNLGPGGMLGLVSTEYAPLIAPIAMHVTLIDRCLGTRRSYPTAIRGTCYGLSAAIGKTGAAIGTQAFAPIETNLGKRSVHQCSPSRV